MQAKVQEIREIGRWIWEKDLSGGQSGNLSIRVDEKTILITGRGTCLGVLKDEDISTMDMEGEALKKGFTPSSEKPFHLSVYKHLAVQAVVHVHPTFCNGYFAAHDAITFDTFETRLTLGDIPVIDQKTPTITDITPVVEALKNSNIVILKHHGVVAVGETLKDAFFLVQTLEEAVKIACIKDFYTGVKAASAAAGTKVCADASQKTFDLFSVEQISEIVRLVNADTKFRELALQTNLETKLAVVLDETNTAFCFHFSNGGIKDFTSDATDAEFVISGKSDYWRSIFKRQLDPFAATTQKKLKLKGDFGKISRWYVPFNRLFDLWTSAPVK